MTEPAAPYPQPDDVTQPFWDAVAEGVLRIQRCEPCGAHVFYPRAVCPRCMSDRLLWVEVSGRGSVYSYTIVHRAPPGFPDAPYVVALIDLEEGPRMMTRLVDVEPAAVGIGQAVEVEFRGEPLLPFFRPLAGRAA